MTSNAVISLFNPQKKFNFARDKHSLLQHLYEIQQGFCAYCGCETHMPRRADTPLEPNKASVEHINPRSQHGADAPHNLLMSCSQCNTEKGNMLLPIFMMEKLPKLTEEQLQRVITVEKILQAYFYQMERPSKKGWINDYIGLNLEKQINNLRQARQLKEEQGEELVPLPVKRKSSRPRKTVQEPAKQVVYVTKEAEPAPIIDFFEGLSPEIKECLEWTKELQENVAKCHPGMAQIIISWTRTLVNMPSPSIRKQALSMLAQNAYIHGGLNEITHKSEETFKQLVAFDEDFEGPDFEKQLQVSEEKRISLTELQLQIQRCLASLEREERRDTYIMLFYLLQPWKSSLLMYLAAKSVLSTAKGYLNMHIALSNYPRLKPFLHE